MQNIALADGVLQPLTPTKSSLSNPQPKNNESHFRITRAYREYWQPRLKPASWSLLTTLISHIRKTGDVYPSHPLLAIEANMSIKSVQRHLKLLRDAGAIYWVERYTPTLKGKAKQTSNQYYFGQNDAHPQAKVTSTPWSESPTNDIEKKEVKKREHVADFKKSSSDVEPSERPLSEKETILVRRLHDLGVEGPVARKYVTTVPDVVERQLFLFQFHAKSRTTEAAHIVSNIQHDWPDPRLKKGQGTTTVPISPLPADIGKNTAKSNSSEKLNSSKPAKLSDVVIGHHEAPIVEAIEEPRDIRADAIRCHAIFKSLSESEQTELLEQAKRDVSPIWHDRLGAVDSPMSLGLWKLVAERYPKRLGK